jgi:hypothetical protein
MTQQPCRTPATVTHGVDASKTRDDNLRLEDKQALASSINPGPFNASRLRSHVLTCKATIGDPTTRRQGLPLTPSWLSNDQATENIFVGAYHVLHRAAPCALSVRKGSSQKTWCRADRQANYITSDHQQNPLEELHADRETMQPIISASSKDASTNHQGWWKYVAWKINGRQSLDQLLIFNTFASLLLLSISSNPDDMDLPRTRADTSKSEKKRQTCHFICIV